MLNPFPQEYKRILTRSESLKRTFFWNEFSFQKKNILFKEAGWSMNYPSSQSKLWYCLPLDQIKRTFTFKIIKKAKRIYTDILVLPHVWFNPLMWARQQSSCKSCMCICTICLRFVQQFYTVYCLFTYKSICIVRNSRKNIVAPCH